MIRIQYFNFIISKFLQMSKLLCNVLKISGGQMPSPPIARLLARFNRRRRMKAENRQIPQTLAARVKFVTYVVYHALNEIQSMRFEYKG